MIINTEHKKIPHPIGNLLRASNVSSSQKEIWLRFLVSLSDNQLKDMAEILTKDPSIFDVLTKNIMEKSKAFKTKNKISLDSILKEEESLLLKIDENQ